MKLNFFWVPTLIILILYAAFLAGQSCYKAGYNSGYQVGFVSSINSDCSDTTIIGDSND